jgi:hypothetical protein
MLRANAKVKQSTLDKGIVGLEKIRVATLADQPQVVTPLTKLYSESYLKPLTSQSKF